MPVKVGYTTFDCADPRAVAEFWAKALSYEINAPNESGGEVLLDDPKGVGPSLGFMKVPEPKMVKNRVHLDLWVTNGSLEEEVERLIAAGARAIETLQDPDGFVDPVIWTVMQDPAGNEFCVLEPMSRGS
jgi:predicted enzyme related to lactoylglutathione lyase